MPSARAATFFFLSIACVYLVTQSSGVIRFLWASIAWSFLGVSGAYALRRPELLGKQPNGTLRLHFLLLWPAYFLLTWGIWFLARLVPGYPHSHEIVPGLWLGAWPNHPSRLPVGTALVVDLTAEFPRRVQSTRYLCLPTLDMEAPTQQQLAEGVAAIQDTSGTVYVHCAAGHGRSATIVAAVLMKRGTATTPAEAEALLQRIRSGVKLTPPQQRLLESATITP